MELTNITEENLVCLDNLEIGQPFIEPDYNILYVKYSENNLKHVDCLLFSNTKNIAILDSLHSETFVKPVTIKEIIFEENQ